MSEDPQKSHEILQEWQRILRDPFETFENPSDYPKFSWNPKVILKDPPESHENLQRSLENLSAGQKIPQNPTKTLQGSLKPLQQVKRFLRILNDPSSAKKNHEGSLRIPRKPFKDPSKIPFRSKDPSESSIIPQNPMRSLKDPSNLLSRSKDPSESYENLQGSLKPLEQVIRSLRILWNPSRIP